MEKTSILLFLNQTLHLIYNRMKLIRIKLFEDFNSDDIEFFHPGKIHYTDLTFELFLEILEVTKSKSVCQENYRQEIMRLCRAAIRNNPKDYHPINIVQDIDSDCTDGYYAKNSKKEWFNESHMEAYNKLLPIDWKGEDDMPA